MGRLAELLKDMIVREYRIIPRNVFIFDPVDGYSNGDGSLERPFDNLEEAYDACTTEKNDCIIHVAKNNASNYDFSEAFDWTKNSTHLIGFTPEILEGKRARLQQLSTATGVTALITFSGYNNIFANVRIFHGVNDATSLVAAKVTGQRNLFRNVEFAGIGHATMSAAGAASLMIDGGAENLFQRCVIGLDTIGRDADATEILFDGAASRNAFEDCIIKSYLQAGATAFCSVTVADAQGIDRPQIFNRCMFMTDSENQGVTQAAVFKIPAMVQGKIVLKDCSYLTDGASGSGSWEANGRGIIFNNTPAAAAAGAGGEMTKL